MKPIEGYLDLNLLINGIMDGFLLITTGRLLRNSINKARIGFGIFVGALPVFLALYPHSIWLMFSKVITPFIMIAVAFPWQGVIKYWKTLIGFWLISASLGGFIYALWGWAKWDGIRIGEPLQLLLTNIWLLPLVTILWWALHKLWTYWQEHMMFKKGAVVDLMISFTEDSFIKVKALIDTGNQLRDPLTQNPVILLEERVAVKGLPQEIIDFMHKPWRAAKNPWSYLLQANERVLRSTLFIPMQTIERESWVLAVRPHKVINITEGGKELAATIALVPQKLSREGEYEALSHPDLHYG